MNRSLATFKRSLIRSALHIGVATSLTAACSAVIALGLGEIHTEAQVGSELTARIDIIGDVNDGDIDRVQVRRVYGDEAKTYGYDLVGSHVPLTFSVEQENGAAYIQVKSIKPLSEPYVEFLLEMFWPKGNVIRQYLVLPAEPPTSSRNDEKPAYRWPGQPSNSGTPGVKTTRRSIDREVPEYTGGPEINPGDVEYEVQSGDLLSLIARNWGRSTGYSSKRLTRDATAWLIENNPTAFPTGNPDELQPGARLRLPNNLELQPPEESAKGNTKQVEEPTEYTNAESGRVVVNTNNVSLTEQLQDVASLRLQIDAANEEISRLRRENDSYRTRLETLESGNLEKTLEQLYDLQQQQIVEIKQNSEAALPAGDTAVSGAANSSGVEASESTTAENLTEEQPFVDGSSVFVDQEDSAQLPSLDNQLSAVESPDKTQNHTLLWLLLSVCGLGVVAFFIAAVLRKKAAEPNLGGRIAEDSEPVISGDLPEESLVECLATEPKLDSSTFAVPTLENKLESLPITQLEEDLLRDDESALAIIEFPLLAGETETKQPEPEEGAADDEWVDRKFGSALGLEISEPNEIAIEADVAPYNEEKLDLMALKASELEMPQFELDEELLEALTSEIESIELATEIPDMEVSEVDIDESEFELMELQDTQDVVDLAVDADVRHPLPASNAAEFSEPRADGLAEDSISGVITEIEMYLQLGNREKANRLLSGLLDDESVDTNDQRMKLLIERCLPKQA